MPPFLNDQLGFLPAGPVSIVDYTAKTGAIGSLYLQDEWHLMDQLTLNYGMRFDKVSAFVHEQQWSPRVNLLYKLSPTTAVHAGYSRYFTPPPQELAAQSSIDLYANTSNAPEILVSDPVKSERTSDYDVGMSHQVNSKLTLTADAYYKHIRNMLDEGQFGQALIMTPFNYARGMAKGLELSAIYDEKNWGGYLNLACQKAQGRDINPTSRCSAWTNSLTSRTTPSMSTTTRRGPCPAAATTGLATPKSAPICFMAAACGVHPRAGRQIRRGCRPMRPSTRP